ncbi:PREDICTED: DNA-directed primase/polymerase protein isoform X2 [Nicotiana attenuata]|uniref:DNA-directed primase/polymerase protein isoform X2 n=1 Tax=Nicotiana attenuata TaxID=49451 RepID=UPI000905109B|nr:PREDICTED: DNA-directed primase/polymerase protein isoform X2 [Nicotiana attenuata]
MDDVDRLFECFKCGISPPQSAIRERKKGKRTVKQDDTLEKLSTPSDVELCLQNLGSSTAKIQSVKKGRQFSPLVFYGSPHGVPPKRPARLLRLLNEIRVDLNEQNKLRQDIWATFPRQDEAMKYAKEQSNARVFSYQDHVNGQRRFLVSTYKEFWRRYETMNPIFRHHYEVIQEGLPCHLYFDLEFNKRENAGKNGDEMVDLLIQVIFDAVKEKYCLEGSDDWVVELDSSNEVLVAYCQICSRISSLSETDGRFRKLFVSKDSSLIDIPHQLFVDKAVYSRNRCFRLALSSKAGKSSVLLPSGRFKCKDMTKEEVFMASLICKIDADCEKLLICKMDLDCVKALQFDTESTESFQLHSGVSLDFDLNACTSDPSRTYLMGKSPFPSLDMFVESVASIGNIPGKIRSWYWFSEYALMVYSMSRNRYCERIGRQHKSNHVIYVVDLRRAVYYQKCHDPDCRGYRSPLRPVPDNVIPHSSISVNLPGHNLDWGQPTVNSDESIFSSCKKEWWLEAIRVADSVENVQKALDLTEDRTCEEDEWLMAVERTAYQSEQSYLGKA